MNGKGRLYHRRGLSCIPWLELSGVEHRIQLYRELYSLMSKYGMKIKYMHNEKETILLGVSLM